ncbi:MAG: MmcQ/YjbR family DNA-binding protein [Rhodospirillaceae bacterium]
MTIERALAKALAAAAHLPGIEQSTTYGSLAVKVHGKTMAAIKDPNTLYLRCAMEDKEMLFASAPEIYYETDHYKGWPGLLVRLNKITKKELTVRLERAWRLQAPAKMIKAFDADTAAKPTPKTRAKKK